MGSEPPNDGIVNTITGKSPIDPLLTNTVSTLTFTPRRSDHFVDLKCVASVAVSEVLPFTFDVELEVQGKVLTHT